MVSLEQALCDQLAIWCAANDYEHLSADELVLDAYFRGDRDAVSWLEAFISRWDAATTR